MARYPNAAWHPSPNHGGSLSRSLGLILHVEQGSEPGTVGWFCNPTSQASSHFGVGKDGHVDQFVDTDLRSWAQVAGNADYWSVETEGFATDLLTDPQVQAIADLYRWLQHLPTAQFDYQLAETPGQPGFGWHGMGGAAWGGHVDCPGPLRKAQRARILGLANPLTAPAPKVVVMAQFDPPLGPIVAWLNNPAGPGGWGLGADGGLYALGGAPFTGSAAGKAYFAGRVGAQLKLSADGRPVIVATSGETYGPDL